MKKIILYSLILIVGFTACNHQTKKENEKNHKTQNKMKTIHLTKQMFLEKVMNFEKNPTEWKYLGDKPCIIDFYADWCGPCKAVAPILEQIAEEYDGKIYVYKIDTEAEQELASVFGIQSIPTIYFCPVGGNPQIAMGALPKATIKEAIKDVLKVQ
jgi:thioredoxin